MKESNYEAYKPEPNVSSTGGRNTPETSGQSKTDSRGGASGQQRTQIAGEASTSIDGTRADNDTDRSGEVECCPECKDTHIFRVSGSHIGGAAEHDNAFRCKECSATFDEPAVRPHGDRGGNISHGLAAQLDEMDADDVGQPMTDGGQADDVVHKRTGRDPDGLSKAALVAEWSEISENLRVGTWEEEEHAEAINRLHDLWSEMRDRTDAEPPECPECGGTRWSQELGEPKYCGGCDLALDERYQETIEAVDDYWQSVQSVPEDQQVMTDGGEDLNTTQAVFRALEELGGEREEAPVGNVINRVVVNHERPLGDVLDEVSRLMANGEIYAPSAATIRRTDAPVATDGSGAIGSSFDDAEQQTVFVGDHVRDLEDDDTTMLVVGAPAQTAEEYTISDSGMEPAETVADYNPEYPATDDVIETVYAQRTDNALTTGNTYAFPRSRLELVASIHDVGSDEGGENDA